MTEFDYYANHAKWYDILSPGTSGDTRFYVKEAKKTKGKVLEIACGTGRIYLELLKQGVDAYGFDISPAMLKVLNKKAAKLGLKPKTKLADMRSFTYPFKFNLVIIPYRAFLHMETRKDQKKCLKTIRRHLKPNGRLILNFFDPKLSIISKDRVVFKKGKIKIANSALSYSQISEYDTVKQHILAKYQFKNAPKGVPKEIPISLTYIFPREFMNLLERCGFGKWELYGGFDRRPYTKNGQELVWVIYR